MTFLDLAHVQIRTKQRQDRRGDVRARANLHAKHTLDGVTFIYLALLLIFTRARERNVTPSVQRMFRKRAELERESGFRGPSLDYTYTFVLV